jgi:hypothetical protein
VNTRVCLLLWAFAALLVAACGPAPVPDGPDASPGAPLSAPGAHATPLTISVTDAKYGQLSARTVPGARCEATLQVRAGVYGDAPPGTLGGQSAGPDGLVSWSYSAPRVPAGTASYTVRCETVSASESRNGAFTIPTHPIAAKSLTVRVTADAPPREAFDLDPSLVPLRDAALAKIKTTLAAEWRSATRGLGALQVDDRSADITMFVVAARGTSVHRTWPGDDSQDIVLFVAGEIGPRSVENNVAVALHELGHIWCCHGPDTSGGHWVTKQTSPGLYGVDRYGIMNEPVLCTQFRTLLSCPNRFSDREMTALGFTDFPAPAPDPCIVQGLSLRAQINTVEGQAASLRAQIRAIEAQYPGGVPTGLYNNYVALVSQHNALVARQNALVAELNALLCDSS